MTELIITLIQTPLVWENKIANLQMLEQQIIAIDQPTHLVVLPEMFSTGFSMQPALLAENMEGPTLIWMKKMASTKKMILTGSAIIEDCGVYYNRLLWVLPNGIVYHYDKHHRFAFAGEDNHYSAGNKRLIVSVNGWKINVQICYDLRFPVWARQQNNGAPEYDLLLYVANWPERRSHAWKTLLQARAIENQCYVIAVNRVGEDGNGINHSGDSMVIDPLGNILFTKTAEAIVHTQSIDKNSLTEIRNKFPFWKDADPFHLLQNIPDA